MLSDIEKMAAMLDMFKHEAFEQAMDTVYMYCHCDNDYMTWVLANIEDIDIDPETLDVTIKMSDEFPVDYKMVFHRDTYKWEFATIYH